MSDATRIDVYLICNAKYHDTSFARLELLTLLAEHEDVVVRVAEDYRDAVGPAFAACSPTECANYGRHAGYRLNAPE